MKKLICELCGSNKFIKTNGLWMCEYCETKYSPDEAKKLMSEVKIDKSDEYNNFKILLNRSIEDKNIDDIKKYSTKVLEIDANNYIALFWNNYADAISNLDIKKMENIWPTFLKCKSIAESNNSDVNMQDLIDLSKKIYEVLEVYYSAVLNSLLENPLDKTSCEIFNGTSLSILIIADKLFEFYKKESNEEDIFSAAKYMKRISKGIRTTYKAYDGIGFFTKVPKLRTQLVNENFREQHSLLAKKIDNFFC